MLKPGSKFSTQNKTPKCGKSELTELKGHIFICLRHLSFCWPLNILAVADVLKDKEREAVHLVEGRSGRVLCCYGLLHCFLVERSKSSVNTLKTNKTCVRV